jgi:hypothetical protein
MKKSILIFIALAVFSSIPIVNAQIINPGFETWTTDILVPSSMNPNSGNNTTGWWDFNCFNSSYLGSSPISVTRCSDTVHSPSYSARIETKVYTPTSWNIYKTWGYPFIGHEYKDTLGILFDGNVDVTTVVFRPDIPCTQKLTQFKFWYQYKPNGNDTAECRVELVNQRNPVAGGWFKTNVPTGSSGWQQAVIDFTYVSALTPDTLWILFSSSSLDVNPKVGSVFWIDDITVSDPAGMEQLLGEENIADIFPNPSKGIFTISQQNKAQSVEVYNLTGEKIYSNTNISQSIFDIDISSSPKGIYFVKITDGEKTQTKKLVIQ